MVVKEFNEFLPSSVMTLFLKQINQQLRIVNEASIHALIDLDRFLDQSIVMFLRFNNQGKDNLSKLYYAWSLFSIDYIEFDQIYMILKFLRPENGQI